MAGAKNTSARSRFLNPKLLGADIVRLSLIERYFFGKAIVSVSMAAAALVGVMWIVRAVQEVDIIMNKGQGILTYLSMISLGVPTLAAAIAPLALLIGLVRTINGLNDDSELVVMHASGASRIALMKPFLATGAIVAIVVFVLQVWVAPNSMASLRGYMTDVRADLVSLIVREGTFNDVGEGMTFHVASRAPGGVLKGVFIQDARGEDEVQTYLAETGIVTKVGDNAFLILDNGQIQRQPRSSEQVSIIRFESYAFDLSTYGSDKAESGFSQMEVPTAQLFKPDPDDKLFQHAPERYRAEMHIRMSGWLYPIAFAFTILVFLGDPVSHRQGQQLVVTVCCINAVGMKALAVVAEGAARDSNVAIAALWLLPLTAIAISVVLLACDKKALPDSVRRSTEASLRAAFRRMQQFLPTTMRPVEAERAA